MATAKDRSARLADLLAARCAACRQVVHAGERIVSFGDLQFHDGSACRPACEMCASPLPPGSVGWRGEGHVVSEPWGYGVRPTRFLCPECLGSAPRDEPRAHF